MCSKHVQAWNKLILKQKFFASSLLITKINILRCTVSKASTKELIKYNATSIKYYDYTFVTCPYLPRTQIESFLPVCLYRIYCHYLVKGMIFRRKKKNTWPARNVLRFPLQNLFETLLNSCIIQRDTITSRADLPWSPSTLLYRGHRVSFLGVKRPRSGVDQPPHQLAPWLKIEWTIMACSKLNLYFFIFPPWLHVKCLLL